MASRCKPGCSARAAGRRRLVRIHPAGPPLGQQRGQRIAPQGVLPAVAAGEQILQIVQHQQQGVLFQHSPQPGQRALAEEGRVVQIGGQGQAGHVQLALHLKEKIVERPAHIHPQFRPFEPDIAHKAPLGVAVGQLQGTGRLARAGHAIEENAPLGVGRGQGLAGPAHGSQPAHKAFRLGGEGDAQTGGGQPAHLKAPAGQGQVQLFGGPAQQNRRGRGEGGIGAALPSQDFGQGQMERAGQGSPFVQQFVVEAAHQVGGEGVAHGVAHGQGRTAQPLGQLLAQAGQKGDPHLLVRIFARRGALCPGYLWPVCLRLAGGRAVQPDAGTRGGVAGRAAVAGVEDEQLQPFLAQFQQVGQFARADAVCAAPRVLQHQLALQAVAGDLHHIPAWRFFQGRAQAGPRRPVLEHAQGHGFALALGQLHQFVQVVAFPAQVEGIGGVGQGEDGEQAEFGNPLPADPLPASPKLGEGLTPRLPSNGSSPAAGEVGWGFCAVDEADAGVGEAASVGQAGQFQRAQKESAGLGGNDDCHRRGGRAADLGQTGAQVAEDVQTDPVAQFGQLRRGQADGAVEVRKRSLASCSAQRQWASSL